MLLRSCTITKIFKPCYCLVQPMSSAAKTELPSLEDALKRSPDQRDITTMDLIEEKIKRTKGTREIKVGGVTQKWNYRSEMVDKHGLDNDHRYIWLAYAAIIILGFTAFVFVKSNVVLNRQEEMQERERIRRGLKLSGSDRKKIGVIEE